MTTYTTRVDCRACGGSNLQTFLSLGDLPLADALLEPDSPAVDHEPRYPLDVAFCASCSLVQLLQEVPPKTLFVDNYLYFSSVSHQLIDHAGRHAARLIEERGLGPQSLVVEVASNDGYLLRHFAERGVRVLGIDPAPDQADAAEAAGIPTVREFFDEDLAAKLLGEHGPADVIIANNVMAHTPTLRSFVVGLKTLLAQDGVATIENPHVMALIDGCEFDTIYHEHFSYFSCTAVDAVMRGAGLFLNRVQEFELHGGTMRWWVGHHDEAEASVRETLEHERSMGATQWSFYRDFGTRVDALRADLRDLLSELRSQGHSIAAYGAAAKGAMLCNSTGIDHTLVDYVVDRNTYKQGHLMPGVHLLVRDPSVLLEEMPDFLLLLAWNFQREIIDQQREYAARGGRFIVPVPSPRIVN